jgi:hypothetical protein
LALTVTDNYGAVATDTLVVIINAPPTANAGADQVVTDADRNGSHAATLSGSSSSDSDGTLASYVWSESGPQIATGASPTVTLTVGTHTITLTVTDNLGATATDTLVVIINAPPTANAGSNQVVTDADRNGTHSATLNGTGSTDSDGSIASYAWSEGATQIATGASPTVTLSLGVHTITLTVTDNRGAGSTATVTISLYSPPLVATTLCDGKTSPANNVSTYTPVFSWSSTDLDPGDSQTAYRLRIGTLAGQNNVFDSGAVASSSGSFTSSVLLSANTTYHWSVQTWDTHSLASGYSADALFIILDIGLRVYDGTQTIKIATDYVGPSYKLRISKGGTTYGIILVDPADPSASKIRVRTSTGVMALKKM